MRVKRYDIVIVNLDPTVGGEIQKTRPCIVVSPDEFNRRIKTVVIIPLTSQLKDYPYRVPIQTRSGTSQAVLEQIRAVDKTRIIKNVGRITPTEVRALTDMIHSMYVD